MRRFVYFKAKTPKLIPIFMAILLIGTFGLHNFSQAYADDGIDQQVEKLMRQMTLEEKIGQMVQAERNDIYDLNDITTYGIGSILSSGDSIIPGTTPEQTADMIDACQKAALQTRLKIPLLYGIDAVHGYSSIVNTTVFPHNIGMGATGDPALTEQAGRITAIEAAATGVKWTFAPCIAVARDEQWGRTYESYGETPELPTMLGIAAIKGLQGGDLKNPDSILACAKHFIGDGGTTMGTGVMGGIDQGDTRLSQAEMRRLFLPPYEAAVKAGVRTVMVSYSSWNGQKMHGNQYWITKVLKDELGFTGFVVSDFRGFEKLPGSYNDRVAAAVNAGIDMFMGPSNYQLLITILKTLVESGHVPMERIDDAAARILRVKYEMRLFERPYAERTLLKNVGTDEHREIARQCVRESLVLLKNGTAGKLGILPLAKNLKRIVVAGKAANDLGYQCGGWTVTWQGGSGDITEGTTILQAIRQTVSPQTIVNYSQDGKNVCGDAAIVIVGERPYAEFQGDAFDPARLKLREEDQQTIFNIKKLGIPMVVVLISGRPLIITEQLEQSDAFIAAWLPGTEGQGVADVLFGDYRPSGKLPCSWPRGTVQIPVNTGDKDYNPLFKYGYGLSY
jgi:Beta-glucosidase-related glycosidases